jgi:hypothetical protein
MSARNKNNRIIYTSIGLLLLIFYFTPVRGDELTSDTTIVANDNVGQVIELCEGQLVKFVNTTANASSYNWKWDLGDGTTSVLVTNVIHYYSPNKGVNYHIKLKQVDGTQADINFEIKINSFNDISTFAYDSIFCINQCAVLKVCNNQASYSLMTSPNYNILKDFGKDTLAIINFITTGESNLLVNASNGTCSKLIELPYLTATSKWYPFEKGKIVQKPVDADVLIYLNQDDQNKASGDLEYSWGKYDKKNAFTEDVEYNKTNKNYYKSQIDTTQYRYFVRVKCNSCNSCESIYFFPEF